MKNFKLILIFTIMATLHTGCEFFRPQPQPPSNEHVTFTIRDVIIGGKEGFVLKDYNNASLINMFEFGLGVETANPFYPYKFILSEGVKLNSAGTGMQLIARDQLDNNDYTYKIDKTNKDIKSDTFDNNGTNVDVYSFDLYDFYITRLFIQDSTPLSPSDIYKFNSRFYDDNGELKKLVLKTSTRNDIVLSYSINGESLYNGVADFTQIGNSTYYNINTPKRLFNYNAAWENISRYYPSYGNIDSMINIIFIADGFTEGIPLYQYQTDVNYDLLNELKAAIPSGKLDNTNIIRMDTLSLNEIGYDIIGVSYGARFGDSLRIKKIINTSFIGGPAIKIDDNNFTNIDLIIIVKAGYSATSYRTDETSAYLKKKINNPDDEGAFRPVHIIVMNNDRYKIPYKYYLSAHLEEVLPEIYGN